MGTTKSYQQTGKNNPSIFALLVDDINQMSEPEQKSLWIQINKQKLSFLAKEIDNTVAQHNYSAKEVDAIIKEAKKYGRKKKG